MGRRRTWTEEQLRIAVTNSASIAQVVRALGLRYPGGSHGTVTRAIASTGLDTSHFTGRSWERIGDPAPGHKVCGKCLREKPLSEFYRRGKGYQSRCKKCHDDALYDYCACGRRKVARYQRCRFCRDEDMSPPRTDISDTKVAWIAGILEGEGCWTRSGAYRGWRVAVRMTDEDIIRRLQMITGIGTITVESSKKGYKTAWCWCVAARVHREWLTVQVWAMDGRTTPQSNSGIVARGTGRTNSMAEFQSSKLAIGVRSPGTARSECRTVGCPLLGKLNGPFEPGY